MTMLLEIVFVT